MRKSITGTGNTSSATYEALEEMVRLKVQEYIQEILEDEVETFLGRKKSERIKSVDGTAGYWNGHGREKKFTVMNGTITIRRPRVRDAEERFESRIIPFFKRRSKGIGQLLPELERIDNVERVICPPFVSLAAVSELLEGSPVELGAQNLYFEEKGAYTGEISPLMLAGLCHLVIVGHSERRHYFSETVEIIDKKALKKKRAIRHNCI